MAIDDMTFPLSNALAARAAANALNMSLKDLTMTGNMTAESMKNLGMALVFVNPALGALTIVAAGVAASFDALKTLAWADQFKMFGDTVQTVTENFDLMRASSARSRGETESLRDLHEKMAVVDERLVIEQDKFNNEIKKHSDLIKGQNETDQEAYQSLQLYLKNNKARFDDLDKEREKLQTKIRIETQLYELETEQELARQNQWEGQRVRNAQALTLDKQLLKARQDQIDYDTFQLQLYDQKIAQENAIGITEDALVKKANALSAALKRENEEMAAMGPIAATSVAMVSNAFGVVAADAFNAYADALDKSISANNLFASSLDRSLRNAAAAAIRSLGQQAAVEATMETALGLKDLAMGLPTASIHFESAAVFAAVALAAGVAAGATSVAAPRGSAPSGGRGGRGADRNGPQINNQFTIIGVMDTAARQEMLRQLAEAAEGGDY